LLSLEGCVEPAAGPDQFDRRVVADAVATGDPVELFVEGYDAFVELLWIRRPIVSTRDGGERPLRQPSAVVAVGS
jgi:hypothetical protein